ncbi:UNVERIFIED_CONTAM: putative NADH dehydrogenase [ubiquinone] 1 alpha subcomplex subunit [Sesamum calycinum]|uniref:NADH dehydrogenase [ubiquinone] 1 alpha subcomplex subunit n=1 Tax=Sesamum calycinum TaxID=2727403 RepID=A0AAW2LR96_9LAMI
MGDIGGWNMLPRIGTMLQVPPEWHGWLHYITDHTGDELLLLKPKRYGVEHKRTFLGREMSTSITRKDIPLTLGNETGPDTNPGNPRRPKFSYANKLQVELETCFH